MYRKTWEGFRLKLQISLCRLALLCLLAPAWLLLIGQHHASAQVYRNVVNTRFRTVSSGLQSALIVDVDDPKDRAGVEKRIMDQARTRLQPRASALRQEIAFLRKRGAIKPNQEFDFNDTVVVRHKGQLQLPTSRAVTRGASDELTFNIVTSGSGAFTTSDAADLQNLVNGIYPQLRDNILGRPGWSGQVTIRNLDPRLGKTDEVLGALLVINGDNVEIWFPTFRAFETRFLAMAQVIAQAFHAKQRIAFDAWEIGMARAAAVALAVRLQSQLTGQNTVDPSNGFYFTPYYDLLNQPALANSTFTPPTKSDQPFNATTLSGMLVPRLQMSSTVWLKCFIENPNFFKLFNTGSPDGLGSGGYYGAVKTDASTANDVSKLRQLAKAVLPNVEGQAFDTWFEQQYILDSSVAPGNKLFVYSQPTFPSNAQGTDSGAAIFVVYYRTTSTGDESDLSGTANLIYWDYNFVNRLLLPSFEVVDVVNGFGTVAPFFNDIGGNPADKMRVAVDVPINQQYVRVPLPAGQTGTANTPNDLQGVLIGADSGSLSVTFEGSSSAITGNAVQGAFGLLGGNGALPEGLSRTQIVFTPTGGSAVSFQRNTYQRRDTASRLGVFPLFVLYASGAIQTLSHTFPAGPQMIALPVRPLGHDLAVALGSDPAKTLLAQYRQDTAGSDKYLRYPNIPLYQPGYGLWSNFNAPFTATAIKGERTDVQPFMSVPLPFGWTQIGSPYNANLNTTSDLQFQYLGGEVLTLAEAISRGYIATGIIGFSPSAGYQDILTTTAQGFPQNTLEAWKGYWIRVLVTEGITLTYNKPNTATASTRATRVVNPPANSNHWTIPLTLRDGDGVETSATFGQAPNGADTFVPALHVAEPPPFTRMTVPSVRFPHSDWDKGGDFLTDIRRSSTRSEWEVVLNAPKPNQTYTLAWQGLTHLPRGTRLTLIDKETGTRSLMQTRASYTFRTGNEGTTRHLQIIAEPRGLGRLRISNLLAQMPFTGASRAAQSVTISYELSNSAEVQIEVRLGGRLVRRLNNGRSVPTGTNQMVWDTRDDAGRVLPGGTYTVEVTAKTAEGEQTRAIAPLLVTR